MANRFFKGLKKGTESFSSNITTIINTLLLSIVYFIGVGITSIIARLFGKEFLDLRQSKKIRTYWSTLNLKKKPMDEYYRQF
ncbi:hypothetical protein JW868_00110 [Candidatus Woesearchaeota archaeon]|nr:hypothetical protein [Candidatus Woesearchaeota archaeon]